ncbi:uncharacterized protein MELLADRAFT_62915 [Melampsora larici-populina 98AG31]|uniref:Secreted protein n=1 Tax=Melampsora larici-populina (strain 98AG31 / pathotype 3-4-7) TaxID=747676 RepID=F4RLE2_MELLP|nr:uncharacterized protein MELLADRAFT_62915 [Melampsora larici-populina 98AG31]EGG06754.1 hypothetical protein MELLADRAFT_62915 [Melampsora larici-populina 98AG31]
MQLSILLISSLLIILSSFSLSTSLSRAPEDHNTKESLSDQAPQLSDDAITIATEKPRKEAAHLPYQLAKEEPANANSGEEKKQAPSFRVGGPPNGTAIPFATGSGNVTHQDQHNTSSTSDTSGDDSLENLGGVVESASHIRDHFLLLVSSIHSQNAQNFQFDNPHIYRDLMGVEHQNSLIEPLNHQTTMT